VVATDSKGKNIANISQRYDAKLPPEGLAQIQTQGWSMPMRWPLRLTATPCIS